MSTGIFPPPPSATASDFITSTVTVEELLEQGWFASGVSPTHLVVRARIDTDSVRCSWENIARTPAQRELLARFLLGSLLDQDDPLPSADDLKAIFGAFTADLGPGWKEEMEASFFPIATGEVSTEYLSLYCFAEFNVSRYLLGSGPTSLTIAFDLRQQEVTHHINQRAFENNRAGFESEGFTIDDVPTREEHAAEVFNPPMEAAESRLSDIAGGRDTVLFLAPLGAYDNIAVEEWLSIAEWDLQDQDGTLQTVRYGVDSDHTEYSQTFTGLESRVNTAPDDAADDWIESASGLTQYYRDMGAYRDITPGDSDSGTFSPAAPPPPPACSGSTATGTTGTTHLARDCSILLDVKDTLAGTGTLNWSKDRAIAGWSGITVGGSPQRITGLSLPSSSLNGTVPAGLERLRALTTLDLSNNQLTGRIPESLGYLADLTTLRLSGNSFGGCVPSALRDVTTNDLASVGLSYCDALAAPPAPSGLSLSEADGVFTISWNEVGGANKYEPQHRIGEAADWTALAEVETTSTVHTVEGGLACGTTYRFRVRAYGDGAMHSAEWGIPSGEETHETDACNQDPVFDTDSYEFTVGEDAAVGDAVGTVTASDLDEEDTLTYSITAESVAGVFSIGGSTGEITVTGALDYETTAAYTLTVQASDGREGTDTATVEITVTDVAEDPALAPDDLSVSLADGVFTLTWSEVEERPATRRSTGRRTRRSGPHCRRRRPPARPTTRRADQPVKRLTNSG